MSKNWISTGFTFVLSGFIGSISGFPEVLFDVVADSEVNVWKRTGFEKMLTENLLLKGLFVMIALCVETNFQLKKNLRSTHDVAITFVQ